jgi:hypothetical protein
MPIHMAKNIQLDSIVNIGKNSTESVPIEISIPPSVDNHDRTLTNFVVRSHSVDNLHENHNNGHQNKNHKKDSLTDLNINEINKSIKKQKSCVKRSKKQTK